MDVSKELVRGCLLYDFKVGLSAAEYVKRLGIVLARHWFQKFWSGDLSLCDKARTGRPQVAIEEDSSQTCGEPARQFNS
ncbi:histone-lysine N-methyltransferase SETMAR [Trichonephila inaurata madagascariensis]|uniref:Histone-lysine N-methyltransferase SETMAR n=1 Tax=Trichonephila inaurata madagascariensis TaxID=2747483 RepID=A0A8X7BZ00_9ARAC|nr:histone-lysine N-methyltransferase SETMAR [Trichonephila inaurata madagascariensis]